MLHEALSSNQHQRLNLSVDRNNPFVGVIKSARCVLKAASNTSLKPCHRLVILRELVEFGDGDEVTTSNEFTQGPVRVWGGLKPGGIGAGGDVSATTSS